MILNIRLGLKEVNDKHSLYQNLRKKNTFNLKRLATLLSCSFI